MKIASTMKRMVDVIAKQESDAKTGVVGVCRRRKYSKQFKTEIAYLRRMHFGRSSEQLDAAVQMELLAPTTTVEPQAANDELEGCINGLKHSRKGLQGLRDLPATCLAR